MKPPEGADMKPIEPQVTAGAARLILNRTTARHLLQLICSPEFGYMLYLNGELQISTNDEKIYHDVLVQVPFALCSEKQKKGFSVLILGGGDGCALKEVLKRDFVSNVVLVDYDLELVDMFSCGELGEIFKTREAFNDSRVQIITNEACDFLQGLTTKKWQMIIVDMTDDWLKRDANRLLRLVASRASTDTIISLNTGADSHDFWRHYQKVVKAGLCPLHIWSFWMPSFGEKWTCMVVRPR